uniref:Serine/threonine protein kinase n=1 Tax=Macrostomum lignano TaxID=282301 RepID=A0A1I8FQM9_9PLAT
GLRSPSVPGGGNPTGFIKRPSLTGARASPGGLRHRENPAHPAFVRRPVPAAPGSMRAWPPAWTPARHRSSLAPPSVLDANELTVWRERADSAAFDQLLRSLHGPGVAPPHEATGAGSWWPTIRNSAEIPAGADS